MGKNAKRRRELREARARARQMRPESDAAIAAMLAEQLAAFREKFGREPGPGDPLMFDPDAEEPRPMDAARIENEMTAAARDAGVDPAMIYAMQTTGLMVTEFNMDKLSDEDIAEWEEAIDRYRRLHE